MEDSKKISDPLATEEMGTEKGGDSDQRLNRYLNELIHMQDTRLLNIGDLQALNKKYQLRPQDIEKLEMLTERHQTRALEYKGRERWDNAIVETERALLFAPLDNTIRLDLAELYLNRSAKYGYLQKDLQRSEHQVDDALELEPDNREARSFQKELKKLQDMLRGKESKKRYIPLIVIGLLILAAAVYPRVRYLLHIGAASEVLPVQSAEPDEWSSRELEWEASSEFSEEFELSLSDRTLRKEQDTGLPSLSVSGYTESLKNSYEKLDVELFYDDESLGVIPLVEEGDAALRKGETAVFSALMYPEGDPDPEKTLRFAVKDKKKLQEESAPEWTELESYSSTPLPQGVYLAMDSRFDHMIEGYDRSYLFMDLRIRNKSREALSRLDISVQWRDENENVIAVREISVVDDDRLPVREGEVRTERIMFSMDKEESARKASLAVVLNKTEKEEK